MTEDALALTKDEILYDHNHDGIDRRGFLLHGLAGTGALCVLNGGVLTSYALGRAGEKGVKIFKGELAFVQISDSHMGFDKPANPDVVATFRQPSTRSTPCPLLRNSSCIPATSATWRSQLSSTLWSRSLKSARTSEVFYVPGEHDYLGDEGQQFRERFGKGTQGLGWYSFEKNDVHFVGLKRGKSERRWTWIAGVRATGMAGERREAPEDQHARCGFCAYPALDGLSGVGLGNRRQRAGARVSEAIWKCDGAERAYSPDDAESGGQRDVSHCVLPQPKPGTAPSPGPMKVPAEQLRSLLGVTDVHYRKGQHALAITDSSLG